MSIDFSRHLVEITETLLPVSAYGDERLRLVEGPPKTEAGDRAIPIPAWLCEHIAEDLAKRGKRRGNPVRPDEPLFVNRVGKALNREKFRETVIHPAIVAAGLPTTLRSYDLRHSPRLAASRPRSQRPRRGTTHGTLRPHHAS